MNGVVGTRNWRATPPGPEQKELEKMFKSKEIDSREMPDSVRQRKEMFKAYSATVFAAHFRKTKARLGLNVRAPRNDHDDDNEIIELGTFVRDRSRSPLDMPTTNVDPSQSAQKKENTLVNNTPCWTWVYTDLMMKKDFVCVAMPAVIGPRSNFTISDSGMEIIIKYDWPSGMFEADRLFENAKGRNGLKLAMNSTKVHAFQSHLYSEGVTENSSLKGDLKIELPKKVQRENDSWKVEKVLMDGIKMILLEFTAFQKALDINDADKSLDF